LPRHLAPLRTIATSIGVLVVHIRDADDDAGRNKPRGYVSGQLRPSRRIRMLVCFPTRSCEHHLDRRPRPPHSKRMVRLRCLACEACPTAFWSWSGRITSCSSKTIPFS